MSPDSVTYSKWGDQLLSSNFDFMSLGRAPKTGYPPVLYSGWVTLVALTKILFANHWTIAIVVLNALANAAVAALLVKAVADETDDAAACWLSAVSYLISYDLVVWTPFVLSDPTFLLISFASFAIAARGWSPERRAPAIAAAAGLSLLAAVYRPNGVLIPLSLVIFATVSQWKRRRSELLIGAISAAAAVLLLNAWLVDDPSRWPGHASPPAIEYHALLYRQGVVVFDRPDTFHAKPESMFDQLSISVDRLAHFFRFTHPSFSRKHNIIASLFFVPVYLLSLAGMIVPRNRRSPVVLMSLVFVATLWFFTSLVQIDFDWRYRVPVLPHLIFLAGVGFASLRERLSLRTSNSVGATSGQ